MNNALRITLIVFALVIIVVVSGNIVRKYYEGKILDYQNKINDFNQKIIDIDKFIAESERQKLLLEDIKQEAKKYDKYTLTYDSPPVTFDYLLNIIRKIGRNINFNFNYSGQIRNGNYIENSYLIKGSAGLSSVYKMINHIEKQQPLYYLHSLALSSPEMTVSDTITYSFMLTSISKNIQPQEVDIPFKKVDFNPRVKGLFVCDMILNDMAAEEKREKRNESLFKPEDALLVAVTDNEAFFRDKNGIFQILKVNDPVYDGFLKEIDQTNGTVTFTFEIDNVKTDKIYYISNGGTR